MRRVAGFTALVLLALSACDRQQNVITETDPFVVYNVPTPQGGKNVVLQKSRSFAEENGMRMYSSEQHFADDEYSVLLTKTDTNIAAANVLRGSHTNVSAYSRGTPTDAQRKLVARYMCAVMNHMCPRTTLQSGQPDSSGRIPVTADFSDSELDLRLPQQLNRRTGSANAEPGPL